MSFFACEACKGPCLIPDWARDSSWYANNPSRFQNAIGRAHRWFDCEWMAAVESIRAEIRALTVIATYSCAGCGNHAFPEPGVLCFWCTRWRA